MMLSMASAAALEFTHTHRPPRTGLTHRVVASSKTTVRRESFSRAIVLRAALLNLVCLPQCGLADGTELEEATRLLTVLDGFLLPPQPATTNEFDQTATPHTRVRDVGVGTA